MAKGTVLVDTSVWIRYFKHGNSAEAVHLDRLLADNRAAVCGPVKAEILSGVRSAEDFRKLSTWMEGLTDCPASPDVWRRIAESRFRLARRGIQQSLIDLWIAWTAHENGFPLWSLDEDFTRMTDVVSFKLYRP